MTGQAPLSIRWLEVDPPDSVFWRALEERAPMMSSSIFSVSRYWLSWDFLSPCAA